MIRNLLALSLIGILAVASGCSICSSCMDEAPNYQGGLSGHEDMAHGRVGSAFTRYPVVEEGLITEGETIIESHVYGAGHEEPAGKRGKSSKKGKSPVRRAGLTKQDIQETGVKPIVTESVELTDADFDVYQ